MGDVLDVKRHLGTDKSSSSTYEVRIACIGNSITQGSHLSNPEQDCYPSQLSAMMARVYGDTCVVKNYGLSGRNMLKNGPNPIWEEAKFKAALSWQPDICFILLGTNDSRPDLWKTHGQEFLDDYLDMINTFKIQNPNTKFIIAKPTPIWEGHRYGGDSWGEKHNDSIMVNAVIPRVQSVANKTGAICIDLHMPFENRANLFPDYLHPNPEGAKHIAQIIFETIETHNLINTILRRKYKDY